MSTLTSHERNTIRLRLQALESGDKECVVAPISSFDFTQINLPYAIVRKDENGDVNITLDSNMHGEMGKHWMKTYRPFLRNIRENKTEGYYIVQYYETQEDKAFGRKTFALIRVFNAEEQEADKCITASISALEETNKPSSVNKISELKKKFLDIANITYPLNVLSSYFSEGDRYMAIKKSRRIGLDYSYSLDGQAYSVVCGDEDEDLIGVEYEVEDEERVQKKTAPQAETFVSIFDMF